MLQRRYTQYFSINLIMLKWMETCSYFDKAVPEPNSELLAQAEFATKDQTVAMNHVQKQNT